MLSKKGIGIGLRHWITWTVLLVACVAMGLGFYTYTNTHPPATIERFETNEVSVPVWDDQREGHGMERCEVLYSTDSSIDPKQFAAMTAVVGGHRLKRWKPHPQDPAKAQTKQGKEYCYFYNDTENAVQDYFMTRQACSMDNPLFQNTSGIVTGAFKTNYQDVAHAVPIEKCVVEIDPVAAKPAALNTFWKSWGNVDCEQLMNDIREDVSTVKSDITSWKLDIDNYYATYMGASNETLQHYGHLRRCHASNVEWEHDYNELWNQTKDTQDRLGNEQLAYNQRMAEWNTLAAAHASNLKSLEDITQTYEHTRKAYAQCTKEHAKCKQDIETQQFNLNNLQEQNQHFKQRILVMEEQLPGIRDTLLGYKGDAVTCSNNVRSTTADFEKYQTEFRVMDGTYKICVKERDKYTAMVATTMNQIETQSNVYYTCLDTVARLKEKIEQQTPIYHVCTESNAILSKMIETNTALLNRIVAERQRIVAETQRTFDAWRQCEQNVAKQAALIAELLYRKGVMTELLKRGNDAVQDIQNKQSDLMTQMAKDTSDWTLKNMEASLKANTQVSCGGDVDGTVRELRGRLDVAKRDLDLAKANPLPCAEDCQVSAPQCLPYKNYDVLCWMD